MRIPATGPRLLQPELLDHAPAEVAGKNLRNLVSLNRWFGGHRLIRRLVRQVAAREERLLVLDVGAASGDMGRALRAGFPNAWVVSADYREAHLAGADPPRVAADALALPFAEQSFDIVYCSLFLHHFTISEASRVLAAFWRLARRAVIVIDLERNPIPYYFVPATRFLFQWQDIFVHDGMLSVQAAWRPGELRDVVASAGLPQPRIQRHLPWFRISVLVMR